MGHSPGQPAGLYQVAQFRRGHSMTTTNGQKPVKKETTGGFRIPEELVRFTLRGAYEGAWVSCRLNVSMRYFGELRKAAEAEDQEAMAMLFGDNVLSEWNLEDPAGEPLPANGEGMMGIPLQMAMQIVSAWVEEVSGLTEANPLGETSGDISALAALSTEMDE